MHTNNNSHVTVPVNVGWCVVIKAFLCGGAEPLCLTGSVNALPLGDTHCQTVLTEDLEFGRDTQPRLLVTKKIVDSWMH